MFLFHLHAFRFSTFIYFFFSESPKCHVDWTLYIHTRDETLTCDSTLQRCLDYGWYVCCEKPSRNSLSAQNQKKCKVASKSLQITAMIWVNRFLSINRATTAATVFFHLVVFGIKRVNQKAQDMVRERRRDGCCTGHVTGIIIRHHNCTLAKVC